MHLAEKHLLQVPFRDRSDLEHRIRSWLPLSDQAVLGDVWFTDAYQPFMVATFFCSRSSFGSRFLLGFQGSEQQPCHSGNGNRREVSRILDICLPLDGRRYPDSRRSGRGR